MEATASGANRPLAISEVGPKGASSGISWGGVVGGAFVAAALGLILLILGTGLGLSAVSPWSYEGTAVKTVAIAGIVWMFFAHLCSSAAAGYVAGRLRTQWLDVQPDEIIFRDTANGLIAWAVGLIVTGVLISSVVSSIAGGAAKAGAAAVGTAATAGAAGAGAAAKGGGDSERYFVDSLFRSDRPREEDDSAVRQEAGRIFATGIHQGTLSSADKTYLTQVIATRTGVGQPEAEKRVNDAIAQVKEAELKARQAADAARKAAAEVSLWTFLALLLGAFTASYAGVIGGRHRDEV